MENTEVTTRLGVTFLIELINSAKRGNPNFKQLGIDQSTMNDLSNMNVSELHAVAETPFLEYDVNLRSLNLTIQRVLQRRSRDELLNSAIRHGASRFIMKLYSNMSHKEFNKRREMLSLGKLRNRPAMLNDIEYDKLATLHNTYGQSHPISEKMDHLRCLLYLSEQMAIDMNRIYQYFYREHKELFVKEGVT